MPHARPRAAVLGLLAAIACLVLPTAVAEAHGSTHRTGDDPGLSALARPSLRAALTRESFYFVMPDRFQNADPSNDRGGLTGDKYVTGYDPTAKGWYHGGDLRGVISKLDYVKGLGTTAIWLTPSFKNKPVQGTAGVGADGKPFDTRSAGYHGYWITDFTQIDPHLGTNADLAALIDGAHARGMKVFFDIITNHTADVIDYHQKPGGPAPYAYVSKAQSPYRDASGTVFDDRTYAGTDSFPALDPKISFPFEPFLHPGDEHVKQPEWLNDLTRYHNRGDTTFSGENSTYGDFFGLDDLFTEQPAVVQGMTDIYNTWIRNYGVDGFRIDTMKHVNLEFWQRFLPDTLAQAHQVGKSRFFEFGEVADQVNNVLLSKFTTAGRAQAVLDFPFQQQAREFAANKPTDQLRDLFAQDDWFTDADSNAYQLPTFLGNHDAGHIGMFLRDDNPGATEAELLQRDQLAHELLYFSRGNPVVYFGDEQGFTGAGNDQAARQDMFPSQDPEYWNLDGKNDNIGSNATPKDDNFDPTHPLYRRIRQLALLTQRFPALRDGTQQTRYSSSKPGIFAFSRTDARERVEHLVVLNNSRQEQTATFPTYSARTPFFRLYGDGDPFVRSGSDTRVTVTVPPLSTVVYRAARRVRQARQAPAITLTVAPTVADRSEVSATLGDAGLHTVSFAVRRAGTRDWTPLGSDDNAPYRVFPDVSGYPAGTQLEFVAVVRGDDGRLSSSRGTATVGTAGGSAGTAIIHYRRPGETAPYPEWGLHLWGDAIQPSLATSWDKPFAPTGSDDFGDVFTIPLADATQTLNYIIHKPSGDTVPTSREPGGDRSFVPAQSREVWVIAGDSTIHTTRPPTT